MIRLLPFALALALLSACGSGIKLNDVPVEDRNPTTVTPAGIAQVAPSTGTGTGPGPSAGADQSARSTVAPVNLTQPSGAATGRPTPNLVYFDYDSFAVKPEFAALIEMHAKYLLADRTRRAFVEGHTDERGGREYNLALGQRRAEAVRRALGLLGVQDAQIEAVIFGKEKPAIQGSSEDAMARNRRAEIVYR